MGNMRQSKTNTITANLLGLKAKLQIITFCWLPIARANLAQPWTSTLDKSQIDIPAQSHQSFHHSIYTYPKNESGNLYWFQWSSVLSGSIFSRVWSCRCTSLQNLNISMRFSCKPDISLVTPVTWQFKSQLKRMNCLPQNVPPSSWVNVTNFP